MLIRDDGTAELQEGEFTWKTHHDSPYFTLENLLALQKALPGVIEALEQREKQKAILEYERARDRLVQLGIDYPPKKPS